MMSKANHLAAARDAAAKAKAGTITYQQQDCQSFVENCVRACGGSMSYAGSNDMYRNACLWIKPIQCGVKPGDMEPGHLLFKHAFDGGEPSKYKADGQGNARHVGLYCGVDGVEVAHSTTTSGRNGAQTAKLSAGWTHYGPAKCMAYGSDASKAAIATADMQPIPISRAPQVPQSGQAVVIGDGSLRLRKQPDKSAGVIRGMPPGSIVTMLERVSGWARVEFVDARGMRHLGWCSDSYLKVGE